MTGSSDLRSPDTSPAVRFLAGWFLLSGLGFGVSAAYGVWRLLRDGELPMTPWGFRVLEGPLTQRPPEQVAVLATALVGVCALDIIAGVWLMQGRRRGGALGLATSPLAVIFGAGFALPFLLLAVPIRVVALVRLWPSLR